MGMDPQTCRPKGKTYRDAPLGELVHFIMVEDSLKHDVVCGSKPAWEKHEEGKIATKRQPPRPSCREAATSSQG
jgi:hypothetical protein